MKRLQLIAVLVGLATIAALSSPAHARLYQMMHGSHVYPAVAAPMPSVPAAPMAPMASPAMRPMVAMPMPGRVATATAGGFGRPHVGVNVYPDATTVVPIAHRDPMDPPVLFDPTGQHPDGPNLYQYVRSNPVRWRDPSGLQIMICTTPKRGYLLGGRHAYLWDTRGGGQSCGMSGSSGSEIIDNRRRGFPDGDEPGPKPKPGQEKHTCNPVPNSDGKEDCVMGWCKKHMNEGIWIPFINDCHNKVQAALKACCLSDKNVPHPRF